MRKKLGPNVFLEEPKSEWSELRALSICGKENGRETLGRTVERAGKVRRCLGSVSMRRVWENNLILS